MRRSVDKEKMSNRIETSSSENYFNACVKIVSLDWFFCFLFLNSLFIFV